jgi:L-2,4-diaminobutyric acid acetyltransferase
LPPNPHPAHSSIPPEHGTKPGASVRIRTPRDSDGAQIWRLARESQTLDLNSPYSYLLLCRHFPETCLVAESEGNLTGFVTGYRPPGRDDTVFIWQIAVASHSRRTGLGRQLVDSLLARLTPAGVRFLEATVAPGNHSSRSLFFSVARDNRVPCTESPFFGRELFPAAGEGASPHEPELLLRLGPFERRGPGDDHRKPKEA